MSEDNEIIGIVDAVRDPVKNADRFNRQQCISGVQLVTLRRFRGLFEGDQLEGGVQQMVGIARIAYESHRTFLGDVVFQQAMKERYAVLEEGLKGRGGQFESLERYQRFVNPSFWKVKGIKGDEFKKRLDALDSLFVNAIEVASKE